MNALFANGVGQWNLVSFLIEKLELEGTLGATAVTIGGVLLCMIVPYLLGSFNFGLIISQKKYNDDIRSHGSGNAGTTNMLRTYGKKAAVLTLLGDMMKAFVAVGLGYLILNLNYQGIDPVTEETVWIRDSAGAAIAGLFVMLGHMFPCFYKFKGGKGVATSGMVILMISWPSFLILFVIFVIIVLGTRYVSLGSVMCLALYPVILTAFSGGQNGTACLTAVLMAVLVIYMHRANIKRLWQGQESKISLGKGKKKKDDTDTPAVNP